MMSPLHRPATLTTDDVTAALTTHDVTAAACLYLRSVGRKHRGSGMSSVSEGFRSEFVWGTTFCLLRHQMESFLWQKQAAAMREGRMDESPETITFISHLHHCEQDASSCAK